MTLVGRFGRTMPDLWQTVGRFPVPVLISLIGTVVVNLDIAGVGPFDLDDAAPYRDEQIYGGLVAGFLASGAAHLYAERRSLGRIAGVVLAILAGLAVAGLCWFLQPLDLRFEFLLPGLVLSVMVAGYAAGADDDGIWMFNARLALAVILSALVTVVFGGGLSAIVESVRYLFGVDFDSDIHPHIWVTGATLVGAVYGLSMVSRDLAETVDTERTSDLLVSGTLLLLNYLLVPLALIYVVILHLYAGKMAIEWELPKGQVGIMVLIFSLGGAGIWLIASPWRGTGSALLRFFARNWFLFLIIPLCLLAIGTWRRIADYGITPERYGLAALGLWVAFLIIWFAVRGRSIQPRIVLGSLCALLIGTSFGPWGAGSVSIASQQSRLAAIMQAEGYFKDGRLSVPETIDAEASGEAHSIVLFLSRNRRLDVLAPIFAGAADNPFEGDKANANDVITVLKFTRRTDGDRGDVVHFNAGGPATLTVPQAQVVSGVIHLKLSPPAPDSADRNDPEMFVEDDLFTIRYLDRAWRMPVEELLETVRTAPRADAGYPPLVVSVPGEAGSARLVLLSLNGRLAADDTRIDNIRAFALLPAPLDGPRNE